MSAEYFTGDDWDISVTLKVDGVATDVSGATSIKAAITTVSDTNPTTIISEVTLDSGATGADWANGVVVAEFAAANTDITPGIYAVEVQVESGGKKRTWPRVQFQASKGTVV